MVRRPFCVLSPLVFAFLLGCSKSGPVRISFVKGGSPAARGVTDSRLAEGNYSFSPDTAVVTFTSLQMTDLGGTSSIVSLDNCKMTYERAKESGAALLDCPFSLKTGTYSRVKLFINKTTQILISDNSFGLFTDPTSSTLMSLTLPGAGASYVPYVVPSDSDEKGKEISLVTPWEVTDGTNVPLYLVTDMNRTVYGLADSGGNPSLGVSSGDLPVDFAGIPGSSGSSEFYSTASPYKPNGSTSGEKFVRIFYDGIGAPILVQRHGLCDTNGPSDAYAFSPASANARSFTGGYYLGKDSSDKISWAIPDETRGNVSVYTLGKGYSIGDNVTVSCASMSSAPAPASGDTYASGAPALSGATAETLYLQAK